MSTERLSTQLTRRPGQDYTDTEREEALVVVALHNGNTRRAAAHLADQGKPISRSTLESWRRRYPDRYEEVQKRELPRLRLRLAEQNEEMADSLLDVMRDNIEALKLKASDPDLSFKERADAQYKLSLSQGIVVDKSLVLRGDPTQITEHRTADESLKGLKRLGLVVDSTAVEVAAPARSLSSARPDTTAVNAKP